MPSPSSKDTDVAPEAVPEDTGEPMIVYREQYTDATGTIMTREHGPMKVSEFQKWEREYDAKKT